MYARTRGKLSEDVSKFAKPRRPRCRAAGPDHRTPCHRPNRRTPSWPSNACRSSLRQVPHRIYEPLSYGGGLPPVRKASTRPGSWARWAITRARSGCSRPPSRRIPSAGTKTRRNWRPSSLRTGMSWRFGASDESLPVRGTSVERGVDPPIGARPRQGGHRYRWTGASPLPCSAGWPGLWGVVVQFLERLVVGGIAGLGLFPGFRPSLP